MVLQASSNSPNSALKAPSDRQRQRRSEKPTMHASEASAHTAASALRNVGLASSQ